jgi:hypothetical protein
MNRTHTWVSTRLSGEVPLNVDDLEIIADAIGMTPMQLLAGIPEVDPESLPVRQKVTVR